MVAKKTPGQRKSAKLQLKRESIKDLEGGKVRDVKGGAMTGSTCYKKGLTGAVYKTL